MKYKSGQFVYYKTKNGGSIIHKVSADSTNEDLISLSVLQNGHRTRQVFKCQKSLVRLVFLQKDDIFSVPCTETMVLKRYQVINAFTDSGRVHKIEVMDTYTRKLSMLLIKTIAKTITIIE